VREGRTLYGLIGNLLVLFAALAVLAVPMAELTCALRRKNKG